MKPVVLYHDDADGFCSAWIAHKKLGDDADYIAVNYNEPVPEEALSGRPVYILDFSYKRPDMLRIAEAAERLVCLDHHKTAVENCQGILGCVVDSDNREAACILTWEHFFSGYPIPKLVQYVDDRDRWQFLLPYSKEINAAIALRPFVFRIWDWLEGFLESEYGFELRQEGMAVLQYQAQLVSRACRAATTVTWLGHEIPIMNTTLLISEIGQELSAGAPFSATWFRRGDGKYIVNLRSQEDGEDVGAIAKSMGGGGHKHAAGFVCDVLPWEEEQQ